jgi:hypothetical protein
MIKIYAFNTLEELYTVFDTIEPSENGCHIFPSRKAIYFYRDVVVNGYTTKVHRFALERKLGRSISEGFLALHHCDVPGCVNPGHLFEGTQKDNVRDRNIKKPEILAAFGAQWQDPIYREKKIQQAKTQWKNPVFREKKIQQAKSQWDRRS